MRKKRHLPFKKRALNIPRLTTSPPSTPLVKPGLKVIWSLISSDYYTTKYLTPLSTLYYFTTLKKKYLTTLTTLLFLNDYTTILFYFTTIKMKYLTTLTTLFFFTDYTHSAIFFHWLHSLRCFTSLPLNANIWLLSLR